MRNVLPPAVLFLIWAMFLKKKMGPPTEEMKTAEMALSEAKQKEAGLYAQEEYQKAKYSLDMPIHIHISWPPRNIQKQKWRLMFSNFNRQVDELKIRSAKPEMDTPTTVTSGVQELVGKWEIAKMRVPGLIQRGKIFK